MKSQLFSKITKSTISELSEKIKAPNLAETFSYVSGVGKKGDFKIYTFFDKAGKIISRTCDYHLGDNHTKYISKYTNNSLKKAEIVNGRAESVTKIEHRFGWVGKNLFSEAITFRNTLEDNHKLVFAQKGQAPQSFEFKTLWNGSAPEIKYTNMDRIFDNQEVTEYLPVLLDRKALRRYEHVYKYQLREQNIEDIFDSFKLITSDGIRKFSDDVAELDSNLGVAGMFDELTGDVYYVIDKHNSVADEVECIAHEVQHAKDFSDMARLKDTAKNKTFNAFYEKSRAKGLITQSKNKKEYNRLFKLRETLSYDDIYKKECLDGVHDDLPIEIPAIEKGYEESEKISFIWRKIMVYFGFWGG